MERFFYSALTYPLLFNDRHAVGRVDLGGGCQREVHRPVGSLYRDFGSNAIEDDVAPINVVAVLKALSVRHIGTCGGGFQLNNGVT